MRRLLTLLGVVALAGGLVGPALAHTPHTGSHEEDEVLVGCEDPDTNEVSEPEDGECPDGTNEVTETQWNNQVTCGETEEDDVETSVFTLYLRGEDTSGDGQADDGTIEACADESHEDAVLQGRIIATGSAEDGGYVAADGTDNNPDQLQGWVRVDVSGDGVEVSCGSEDGNMDATHPGAEDGPDECGSEPDFEE